MDALALARAVRRQHHLPHSLSHDHDRARLGAAVLPLALAATYALLGACWLVMKTEGALQDKAVHWARMAWVPMVLGMALLSAATPWVSATVRERWFAMPQ